MSESRRPIYHTPQIQEFIQIYPDYRILNRSQELACLAGRSGALQTFHIFIASSDGHMVKIIVPSGLRQLCPTAPVCALTLSRRRYDGYECTVIEFASDVCTAAGRPLALRGALGSHAVPCVLSSSFECGDHWREVMAVFRGITWRGCGMGVVDLTVKTRIFPSG